VIRQKVFEISVHSSWSSSPGTPRHLVATSKQQTKVRRVGSIVSESFTLEDDLEKRPGAAELVASRTRSDICEDDTALPVRKAHDHYRQGGQSKQASTRWKSFQIIRLPARSSVECDEAAPRTTKAHARVCSIACQLRVVASKPRRPRSYIQ
jgi:hypothetical protein